MASVPLLDRVPQPWNPDAAYDTFEAWASERGLPLYPAQDEALIELVSGANVILSTPTGTGKSLVAIAAQAKIIPPTHIITAEPTATKINTH